MKHRRDPDEAPKNPDETFHCTARYENFTHIFTNELDFVMGNQRKSTFRAGAPFIQYFPTIFGVEHRTSILRLF